MQQLIERKQYMQTCDEYITGSNAYLLSGKLATLLTGRYITTSILPLQFAEYYEFIAPKPPNLSKSESLAIWVLEGGVPEYFKQMDFNPVYNGIRKLNVADWLLANR